VECRDAVAKIVDRNQPLHAQGRRFFLGRFWLAGMDTQILNVGLDMAMEFGENCMRPIQGRLHARYPHLSEAELNDYNAQCRAAMSFGHAEVPKCWHACGSKEEAALELFRQRVLAAYAWVSADNLRHLFSQGCYYAWKDGEL